MRSLALLFLVLCTHASAQIILRVNGAPASLAAADMVKLARHTVVLNEHGNQITYEGALMQDVLALGGVDLSKGLRGSQLSSYVTALATDGYQVVYSLADFDPTIVDSGIILADKRDGKALDAHEGPYRIVVPHDKRPARSIRLLHEIDVVQLKK